MPGLPVLFPCVPESSLPRQVQWIIGYTLASALAVSFLILPISFLLVLLCVYWSAYTSAAVLVGLNLVGATWPSNSWPWFRSLLQFLYVPFNFKHNMSSEKLSALNNHCGVEGDGRVVFSMHPHGIVPIQSFLWGAYCDQYTDCYGFGGAASVVLRMPVLRQVMSWMQAVPADYKTLSSGMDGKIRCCNAIGVKPKNLFMLSGGIAELFHSSPGTNTVVFRKGLCRLSLEKQASLVPIYLFGGNDFFSNFATGTGFAARISRQLRMSITMFYGYLGLPLPYLCDATIVMGDPIPVDGDASCQADVDKLHQRYLFELTALFDKYKAAAGYPEATLTIVHQEDKPRKKQA